ncbi:TRAP transporter small permease [Celeribacter arenosi]|uniref:TRAP transporter small permease protein n=1 Tax=Celeribacter arenosi TaxID=792649 RepID=A0ABP7K4D5_9RHOB
MAERLSVETNEQGGQSLLFRALHAICIACASAGGFAIFATALVVTYSITTRNLGLGGVRGDFELVELVCVACASLFLPLCQFTRGHVLVDIFTLWMSPRAQGRIDGFWMLLFAVVWAILAWRLTHGLSDFYSYGDKSMLLRFPIWLIYVPAIIGTGLSAIVAFLMSFPLMFPTTFRGMAR